MNMPFVVLTADLGHYAQYLRSNAYTIVCGTVLVSPSINSLVCHLQEIGRSWSSDVSATVTYLTPTEGRKSTSILAHADFDERTNRGTASEELRRAIAGIRSGDQLLTMFEHDRYELGYFWFLLSHD